MFNKFLEDLKLAIYKHGDDHIDICKSAEGVYGLYHSSSNSFVATKVYHLKESGQNLCNLADQLHVGYCEGC